MKKILMLLSILMITSCVSLDKISNVANMFDSKQINFHDMLLLHMKQKNIKASSFVDSYLATFEREDYDSFKNDELSYDEQIKKWTSRLQERMDGIESGKVYKFEEFFNYGKYNVSGEYFDMGTNILSDKGYLNTTIISTPNRVKYRQVVLNGPVGSIVIKPEFYVINSDKSKVKLPEFMVLKPKKKTEVNNIKIKKSLAKKITGSDARSGKIRFDFKVSSLTAKKISHKEKIKQTGRQYLNNVDPGYRTVTEDAIVAEFDVDTVRVFNPDNSDQLMHLYQTPE